MTDKAAESDVRRCARLAGDFLMVCGGIGIVTGVVPLAMVPHSEMRGGAQKGT